MNEDYIYNTIVTLLNDKTKEPKCVTWRELQEAVAADVQQIINALVSEKRITFRRDVNKQPLFFIN